MPVGHFLRCDYLHILFYIKFLGFVSLVYQIRIVKDFLHSEKESVRVLFL
jgi:hypothetical protein